MSIFDEIKNPIKDEKKLMQIVKYYSDSDGSLYEAVNKPKKKLTMQEKLDYQYNFNKYVMFPAVQMYMDWLSNVDSKKYEEAYQKIIDSAEDEEKKFKIEMKNFHPIEKYKELFKKYSIEDLYEITIKNQEKYRQYNEAGLYPDMVKKTQEQVMKETGLTEEDIFIIRTVNKLRSQFDGGNFVMGFHINRKNLQQAQKRPSTDMKFYINAGVDTYKIAGEFWKKCNERKLDYYFKVARPYCYEEDRNDKMCVYISADKAAEFIKILREIRMENPDLDYQNPPILAGTVDDWIGVGVDPEKKKGSRRASYNQLRSEIIAEAIKDVLGDNNKECYDKVKKDKSLLKKLQLKIMESAEAKGVSKENFAIDERIKDTLQKIDFEKNSKKKSRQESTENKPEDKKIEPTAKPKNKGAKQENKETKENNNKLKNKSEQADSVRDNLKELKTLLKEMAMDYTTDYEAYRRKDSRLRALTKQLYEQKEKALNIKESPAEKGMNLRRLDAIVSNVLYSAKKTNAEARTGEISKLSMNEFKFSMQELDNYMSELIEADSKEKEKRKSIPTSKMRKEQVEHASKKVKNLFAHKSSDRNKKKKENDKVPDTQKTTGQRNVIVDR